MKKTYLMPTTKWVEAEAEEILAGSGLEQGFNLNDTETTDQTEGNLSRHSSVWGDDEE